MKRIIVLLVVAILMPIVASAQTGWLTGTEVKSVVIYEGECFTVEVKTIEDPYMPGERLYRNDWIVFSNKSDSTVRIDYRVETTLVNIGKKFKYLHSVTLEPHGSMADMAASHNGNYKNECETSSTVRFELIDYDCGIGGL